MMIPQRSMALREIIVVPGDPVGSVLYSRFWLRSLSQGAGLSSIVGFASNIHGILSPSDASPTKSLSLKI